jgi:hypothetical protein
LESREVRAVKRDLCLGPARPEFAKTRQTSKPGPEQPKPREIRETPLLDSRLIVCNYFYIACIKGEVLVKNLFCVLVICSALMLSTTAGAAQMEQVVGIGLGLPYGRFGVNYEHGLSDWFAPTAGIGRLHDDAYWNIGGRLNYPGRDAKLRGRLTALYGTDATLHREFGGTKALKGFSGGIGIDWRYSKNWGIGADISPPKRTLRLARRGMAIMFPSLSASTDAGNLQVMDL